MKRKTQKDLNANLLQLQNLIKRDPSLYYDEFFNQHDYYKSLLELFMMDLKSYNEQLADLVMFLAQVSSCYKEDLAKYPSELMHILKENYNVLDADMRMCFCKALILMRNRGIVEPVELVSLFFHLLRAKDKSLRKLLQTHITSDIKNMNMKHKNVKLNTTLQNLMYKILSDESPIASKMSLDIMIELYKRNVWNDAKTVNAIATACFSSVNKVLVAAHLFFLGSDEEAEESSDSEEDDIPNVKEVMMANQVNKKSRRRMKILKRTKQALKKTKKKKKKEVFDFSAIHLIHDPQGMAEKLLRLLSDMNEIYNIKMLVMNLISRLVGVHQLILLNFYPFLIRYLKPRQAYNTKILTFAAQAAHEYVPPDSIEPVVKTIAENFVSERNSDECITVGINAIREICVRCPLAISQDLLHDIVEYKSYKNKNVQMAARSLIQLFRKINPQMLKRKFKARPTEASKELDSIEYGALKAKSYIPGSEVLPVEPSNEDNNGVAVDSDEENDSDGSWIDVSHSEDEVDNDSDGSWIDVSHSEDEVDNDSDQDDDENEEDNSDQDDDENEEDNSDQDDENEEDISDQDKKKEEDISDQDLKNEHDERNHDDTKNYNKKGKDKKTVNSKNIKEDAKTKKYGTNKDDEKQKAMIISQSRILSQEEFKKLKAAQISKEVKFAKGKKLIGKKRKIEDVEVESKEIVSLKDIEKLHKKPKADKESRLATVQEGRVGREKFGKKKKKKQPFSSKSQKQHNKNKAFMMIKHKVRSKQKRSFKDKQVALRNALLKRRKNN